MDQPLDQPLLAPELFDDAPVLETGDGAEACAAIEAWLARRAMIEQPDWEGVLAQIRDGLARLTNMPLIQNDPEAIRIIVGMASAEEMEQFAADMDRLSVRVTQLLGGPASKLTSATVLKVASLRTWSDPSQPRPQEDEKLLPRMVMRL